MKKRTVAFDVTVTETDEDGIAVMRTIISPVEAWKVGVNATEILLEPFVALSVYNESRTLVKAVVEALSGLLGATWVDVFAGMAMQARSGDRDFAALDGSLVGLTVQQLAGLGSPRSDQKGQTS